MLTLGQGCIDTFNLYVKSYLKCYGTSTIEAHTTVPYCQQQAICLLQSYVHFLMLII